MKKRSTVSNTKRTAKSESPENPELIRFPSKAGATCQSQSSRSGSSDSPKRVVEEEVDRCAVLVPEPEKPQDRHSYETGGPPQTTAEIWYRKEFAG